MALMANLNFHAFPHLLKYIANANVSPAAEIQNFVFFFLIFWFEVPQHSCSWIEKSSTKIDVSKLGRVSVYFLNIRVHSCSQFLFL